MQKIFAKSARSNSLKDQVEVIYDDEFMIAISKPSGMPTMPCESATWTAAHAAAAYVISTSSNSSNPSTVAADIIKYGVVHRLDKEVSGLLILAKSQAISKILSRSFLSRSISKYYVAIVHGDLKDKCRQNDTFLH